MRQFIFRSFLIAAFISLLFALGGCSTAPEKQDPLTEAQAHLLAAQTLLTQANAGAADLNPAIQGGAAIAGIALMATGNDAAVPLASGISAALQATNIAISTAAQAKIAAQVVQPVSPTILPIPAVAKP
jgi:hypothetical protein